MKKIPTLVKTAALIGVALSALAAVGWVRGGALGCEAGDTVFTLGAPLATIVFKIWTARHVVLTDADSPWALPFLGALLTLQLVVWGLLFHIAIRGVRSLFQKNV